MAYVRGEIAGGSVLLKYICMIIQDNEVFETYESSVGEF